MIKILLVVSAKMTAVNYYRQIVPHSYMSKMDAIFEVNKVIGNHDKEKDIAYIPHTGEMSDDQLKEFQIVCVLRNIGAKGMIPTCTEQIDRLHKLGANEQLKLLTGRLQKLAVQATPGDDEKGTKAPGGQRGRRQNFSRSRQDQPHERP